MWHEHDKRPNGVALMHFFVPLPQGLQIPSGLTIHGRIEGDSFQFKTDESFQIQDTDTRLYGQMAYRRGYLVYRFHDLPARHWFFEQLDGQHRLAYKALEYPDPPDKRAEADASSIPRQTVVEVLGVGDVCLQDPDCVATISIRALTRAVQGIAIIQEAYRQITNIALRPITPMAVQPVVVTGTRLFNYMGDLVYDQGVGITSTNQNVFYDFNRADLSPEKLDAFRESLELLTRRGLFSRYATFRHEAIACVRTSGDVISGVVNAAIALGAKSGSG